MMKTLLYIGALLLVGLTSTRAQTVNTGELYVGEGTIFSTLESFDNQSTASFYNDGEAYFYSNFNNDGVYDYLQDTGSNFFIGSHPQSITGSQMSYFYNIHFENSSAFAPFYMVSPIDIGGEAAFVQGVVDNINYGGEIYFSGNASTVATSDASFVNGAVFKLGANDLIFPIGDDTYYRLAGIMALENRDAQFKAQYFIEDPGLQHDLNLHSEAVVDIDNQEYWTIENLTTTTEDNAFITLSWRDVTTPQFILDAVENETLTIVRWDDQLNMWVDEGGTLSLNDQTITTKVEGFGIFTLASMVKPLVEPCHIVVYNAVTPNGDGVNDYFKIDNQGTCAQNLRVKIFNRWGVQVFETDNYGPNGDVFDGWSSGRMTISKNKNQLPTGTYFYILEYNYDSGEGLKSHQQAGYLYLSGN